MVKRSVRVRLQDILDVIDRANEIFSGMSFVQYKADFAKKMALERCVEIVSEASKHIPAELKNKYSETHWDEIRAIGNFLRHDYQHIDDLIMWRIATNYFQQLRPVIAEMLEAIEGDK